ncbi:ArsC/Spx/MgsR family protein [Ammoniphilus sp. YIM 78166]|uniref:ArsC/Spx/MgsR family protein n=1 Tax=Ammoniphilus sp. YIM 78166 TaxID=1644106 RepID=UPI00106F3C9B|nr:ArsC/Spx/MgsR family protein [Ammoniphilus sp. YIM 78166]
MDKWTLYGKTGNPSYDVTKAWMSNHGIPFENQSIYRITREEIEGLAKLMPGGAKSLAYPTPFSYAMMNPQRASEKDNIEDIQNGSLPEEEVINRLAQRPYLIITPILTNGKQAIVGYQYDTMVSTFRFVKVKGVEMV